MHGPLRILLLVAGLACALPAPAQPPAASPLLGTWAVDVSRLPVPPEARPKSVIFTFSDAGAGKWTTQVEIVPAQGAPIRSMTSYMRDGTPTPVLDSPEADVVAVTTPRPDVLIMVLSKGGRPGSTRVITVAPDAKSYVETATYFGEGGKPVMRTNYFTRLR